MGSVDYGTQNITFDYLHPAKGANFNTLLLKGIRPGVYSGGAISASTGTTITIGAFTSYINTIDGTKTVRIATENTFNFTVTDSAPPGQTILIGITYEWLDQAANYFEPFQRTLGSRAKRGPILTWPPFQSSFFIPALSRDRAKGPHATEQSLGVSLIFSLRRKARETCVFLMDFADDFSQAYSFCCKDLDRFFDVDVLRKNPELQTEHNCGPGPHRVIFEADSFLQLLNLFL